MSNETPETTQRKRGPAVEMTEFIRVCEEVAKSGVAKPVEVVAERLGLSVNTVNTKRVAARKACEAAGLTLTPFPKGTRKKETQQYSVEDLAAALGVEPPQNEEDVEDDTEGDS